MAESQTEIPIQDPQAVVPNVQSVLSVESKDLKTNEKPKYIILTVISIPITFVLTWIFFWCFFLYAIAVSIPLLKSIFNIINDMLFGAVLASMVSSFIMSKVASRIGISNPEKFGIILLFFLLGMLLLWGSAGFLLFEFASGAL
jgi:hypothetical protein